MNNSKSKNVEKNGMEHMRKNYENQIYDLNQELAVNYERLKNENDNNSENNKIINPAGFLEGYGIEVDKIKLEEKSIFVLMPFLESKREVFNSIKEGCSEAGFYCSMGDDVYIKRNILSFVINKIVSAKIIIACIDSRNPNVFYELGIAHALGKPTIIVSSFNETTGIPFDLTYKNIIRYRNIEELKIEIGKMLCQMLYTEL